jgi:hypothetical protein
MPSRKRTGNKNFTSTQVVHKFLHENWITEDGTEEIFL